MPQNKLARSRSVSSEPMSSIVPPPPPPPPLSPELAKDPKAKKAREEQMKKWTEEMKKWGKKEGEKIEKVEDDLDKDLDKCIKQLSEAISSKMSDLIKQISSSSEYEKLSPENRLKAIITIKDRAIESMDVLARESVGVLKNAGRTIQQRAAVRNWTSITSNPEVLAELQGKLAKIREEKLKLKKLNREISQIES